MSASHNEVSSNDHSNKEQREARQAQIQIQIQQLD